jgi:putative oxidoreductase
MKKLMHNPDLGLLIFRLFIGLTMAFSHGLGKLPPPEQLVTGVAAIGFPMPFFFAWCAALSEFLGGILIALGLFTRYAALFLGFTMAVAGLIVHSADPFQVKELAFLFLASAVLLVFSGAGRFSLDRILRKA